jgi:HAD superfamily hydrolase (TIGR01450 family)
VTRAPDAREAGDGWQVRDSSHGVSGGSGETPTGLPGGGLLDGYDGVLLDLDGTVYRGRSAVPGAVPVVRAMQRAGVPVGYITNNASRGAAEVAAQLAGFGFAADARHVITSAQAGAALLAQRLPAGSPVLVVGTAALAGEVEAAGLAVVRGAADTPAGVVQGHSPDTCWADLAEACLAIRAGAAWVACNVDPTLPTERGELPGNGAMVAALRAATGREPLVAGKPQRRLLDQAAERLSLRRPLVVGDRLDTDVAGARAAGMAALLVLTGVSGPADLLAAPPGLRPRFVAADLGALGGRASQVEIVEQPGWLVEVDGDGVLATLHNHASGTGGIGAGGVGVGDPLAALRALCAACWSAGVVPVAFVGGDEPARAALAALRLPAP